MSVFDRFANAAKALAGRDSAAMVRQGGGRVVPLDMPQPPPPTSQAQSEPMVGPAAQWFGPNDPMRPTAPAEVMGRRNDFNSGYNLRQRPRQEENVSFEALRELADGYDLLRLAIETRKDQMSRLNWEIVPRDEKTKMSPELEARTKKYTEMLLRPDREHFWKSWLRSLLEDLLVIDAPSIYIRRTRGGDVFSLDQIDGGTIKRVIDEWGRTPEAPNAAYQQILKGLPAVNYTKKDLMYRPRNVRVHKFYGYSPVEQVLMTVNIALRRQMWQLSYFTDGNIPDSLIGVPSTWTPDQIRVFQDWFDGMLAGNSQRRRGATFVPGEVAKSYVPTKEAEIFGSAEEWLARVIAYCFGLPVQALVKETNRATAETAQIQAIQDGLAPIMEWVKELVDSLLIDEFGELELEFQWQNEKELDPQIQMEIVNGLVDNAKITLNEGREMLGLEPSTDPEANILGYKLITGFVPLNQEEAIKLKKRMMEEFPPPPALSADGEDPENPDGGGSAPPPKGKSSGTAAPEGEGGGSAGPKDDAKPPPAAKHAHGSLAKGASPADKSALSVNRPAARRARKALARTMRGALSELGDDVAAQVEKFLARKGVAKADQDHGDGVSNDDRLVEMLTSKEIDDLVKSLDLSSLDSVIDAVSDDLGIITGDATRMALGQLGAELPEKLVDRVNEKAVAYAKDRAAELVGKRVLPNGDVIDNPNARWAIDQSTRDMIRDTISKGLEDNLGSDAIIESLQSDYAFSPERADMVSRTEIATANSESAMDTYREAKGEGISVQKEWLLGSDPCEVCQANADQGPIDLDDDFDSGDDTSPAHPNCECVVVPVVGDSE